MADYIPYTQTKEYFQTKVKEGCEQINCGSSATGGDSVIFKQPLKYKNFTLPLFYRLFSTGVDLNLLIGNEKAKNFLERLVSNPLCLRCQIIGRPFKNRAELPLFNHTLYTYLLDLEVNQNSGRRRLFGIFVIKSSQPNSERVQTGPCVQGIIFEAWC